MTRRLKPWEFTNPACAGEGTSPFYAPDPDDQEEEEEEEPAPPVDYTEAKSLCAMCVHREDCAEWGIDKEVHGVWGGLDPEERRLIKRRRARVRSRRTLVPA